MAYRNRLTRRTIRPHPEMRAPRQQPWRAANARLIWRCAFLARVSCATTLTSALGNRIIRPFLAICARTEKPVVRPTGVLDATLNTSIEAVVAVTGFLTSLRNPFVI